LVRDPSLRFTESGRSLLVWLRLWIMTASMFSADKHLLPADARRASSSLAHLYAKDWLDFADTLERRTGRA
jgi:hypothetical protein